MPFDALLQPASGACADRSRCTDKAIEAAPRGTGQSICSAGQYALQNYVDDLEAVRRSRELEHLALFAHSWGGMVAQLYATRHPERIAKLCLSNSSIGLGDDWRLMERAVMAHNRRRSGIGGFVLLGLDQMLGGWWRGIRVLDSS